MNRDFTLSNCICFVPQKLQQLESKYLGIIAVVLTIISLYLVNSNIHYNNASFLHPIDLIHSQHSSSSYSSSSSMKKHCDSQILSSGVFSKHVLVSEDDNNNNNIQSFDKKKKHAYVQVVDVFSGGNIFDQLCGIIAFQGSLLRVKSKYEHVVLFPKVSPILNNHYNIETRDMIKQLFEQFPAINALEIDTEEIDKKRPKNVSDTFHRLYALKLMEYDKILLTQYNVLMMNNMDMVFTFPTPSAPPERYSGLQANIVAFLLSPDQSIYETMLQHLPMTSDWQSSNKSFDAWNMETGNTEGLLNSVFWHPMLNLGPMYMLPYQYGLSTNKLSNERQRYFLWWRKHMLKLVEFVDDYPTLPKAKDRFKYRVKKMINREHLGWPEQKMTEFMAQFWLDFQTGYDQCGQPCQEYQKLDFQGEIDSALRYQNKITNPAVALSL